MNIHKTSLGIVPVEDFQFMSEDLSWSFTPKFDMPTWPF